MEELDRRPGSILGALLTAVAIALGGFAAGIAVTLATVYGLVLAGALTMENLLTIVAVGTIAQGIGFGLVAFLYLRHRDAGVEFLRLRLPTTGDLGWIVGGTVLLLGSLALLSVLLSALGVRTAQHEITGIAQQRPEILLVMIPLSFLVIGPGEELLFRGVIQTLLVRRLGLAAGVVAASFVFALGHLGAYWGGGVAASIVVLFVLSLVLGAIYEFSDNLLVPMIVHGAYNALLFAGLYVALTRSVELALLG